MFGSGHLIADGGNDEGDEKCEKAVQTACRVKIIDAHVFRQEVCMPCGIAGAENLVDRRRENDQCNERDQQGAFIFHKHRKKCDAEDIDGVIGEPCGKQKPFSFRKMLKDQWPEHIQKASDVRHECEDTDL